MPPKMHKNKEWLNQKYNIEQLSTFEIAKLAGVHRDTITSWMDKFQLPRRDNGLAASIKLMKGDGLYRDKDWLHQKYVLENLSMLDISRVANVDKAVIRKWIKRHGIKVRTRLNGIKLASIKGKYSFERPKGEKHHCFGRKLTEEHKKKIGDAQRGELNYQWKGGRIKHTMGYVSLKSPEHPYGDKHHSLVLEHRVVMEKHLGRFLKPKEVVHHINGIKDDNRLENLFLFASNKHHSYYHKMINLGREVELKYEYEHLERDR